MVRLAGGQRFHRPGRNGSISAWDAAMAQSVTGVDPTQGYQGSTPPA